MVFFSDTSEGVMDHQGLDNAEHCLTPRERDVVALARRGYTNSEIAGQLGITRNAVRYHLKEIHSKLGTCGQRNRLERGWRRALALLALPLGKTASTMTIAAVATALVGGAYAAYRIVPREDAIAAPARFEGTVIVDGTPQPSIIVELSPGDGSIVSAASTQSPDQLNPSGVCVRVRFVGTPETGRWFRLFVDGTDVTAQSVWKVPHTSQTETGTLCYAPEAGLPVGRRTAELRVKDPNIPGGVARETARWSFTVAP